MLLRIPANGVIRVSLKKVLVAASADAELDNGFENS